MSKFTLTRVGGRKRARKSRAHRSSKKRHIKTKKRLYNYKKKLRGGGDEITIKLDDSELRDMAGTQEFFVDPVIASDGQTYERSTIQKWMSQHNTSPFTREELTSTELYPNIVIQKITRDYVESLEPTNDDKIAWNERLAQVMTQEGTQSSVSSSLESIPSLGELSDEEIVELPPRRRGGPVGPRDAPINWEEMEEELRQMAARARGVDPALSSTGRRRALLPADAPTQNQEDLDTMMDSLED